MTSPSQSVHFKAKKHRYAESLLFNPPLHTREETSLLIDALKKRRITSVVEFGSGNGRLTFPLLMNGISVVAVDISDESLRVLSSLAHKKGFTHLTTAKCLPTTLTQAIVGCDILHHVDLSVYLKQMKQSLKKNGVLVFSEPNIFNIAWAILITFSLDWRIEWRVVYCNYFTLLSKLKTIGFASIEIKGHGLLPPPLLNSFPRLQKLNYFLGDLPVLKLFAYRYIISAF